MAAPITHIVFADKIFDKYFSDKEKPDFFLGTSFPDIRYPAKIERSLTHLEFNNINDIQKDDSFIAGLKFHNFLDKIREEFIVSKKLYAMCPDSKTITMSVKFLEDEIFYSKLNNWKEFSSYFDNIISEETNFNINKDVLENWHTSISKYISNIPEDKTRHELVKNMGFPEDLAIQINNDIKIMKSNSEITNIINDFYNKFDLLIN